MSSEAQSYIRASGDPKQAPGESTQYTGIYLKVRYPGKDDGFDILFNNPVITSLGMSSSPQWAVEPAAGRADPLYRLESFTREIRLSFNLPAFNAAEHDDNYYQLNRLSAATLPYYDRVGNNGFNGCHVAFFIGGADDANQRFLQGMAVISSVDFNWEESTQWLAADSAKGYKSKILPNNTTAPMMTSVQMNLMVLSLAKNFKRYHLEDGPDPATEMFFLRKYSK